MANKQKYPWSSNRESAYPLEWMADYSIDTLSYRIIAYQSNNEDGDAVVYEAVPKKYTGGTVKPTFTFTNLKEMQSLMNSLWELGLRPNAYTITNEHFNSVKEHLGDMKALVERAYKLEFPKPETK